MRRNVIHCALGANLPSDAGDPLPSLKAALTTCAEFGLTVTATSRFYQTPCFPAGAGPDYVNAAATLTTDLSPLDVLNAFHQIEARFARTRDTRWGMRTLDMDLLAYGDLVCPDQPTFNHWWALPADQQALQAPDHLILPHPRIQDRAFVLVPLCDIAPDWVHPVLGKTAREMLDALPAADRSQIVAL